MSSKIEWNSNYEKLLKIWLEKAYGYRWIHDRCSKFYRKRNRIITIPTLLLSTLSSAVSFSNTNRETTEKGTNYLMSGVTITSTILIALQNYLKFQSEYEKHRMLSYSFSSYYREIQSILVMPREYRDDPIDIINNKRVEYDRLLNNQVHIPNAIINEYTEKFKGKISLIDIANGIESNNKIETHDASHQVDLGSTVSYVF